MPGTSIITSSILSRLPELVHGVSTKPGGINGSPFHNNMSFKVGDDKENVKQSRAKFFGSLGIDEKRIAVPQQIHSDNVLCIDEPGYYKNADGLITKSTDLFLIISTADCYSVMIYDRFKKVIANIHSGWRGTQKKIVTGAIRQMRENFGSRNRDLSVFIGPGIGRENFEVGAEVAELFDEKYKLRRQGKYFIDLRRHIIDQLIMLGIEDNQIEAYPHCTFSGRELLHSYRRDREKSGRMFGVIGMRK